MAAVLQFDPNAPSNPAFAISYSAASKSYTVSRGGATQTFAPANIRSIDASNGLADVADQFTFYDKSTASMQDLLFLTKAGSAGQTRYVGGGMWVHGSDASNAGFHLFSYGFATPDAATPRTGSASFDLRAVGTAQIDYDMHILLGEGSATADFATGSIEMAGLMRSVDVDNDALSGAYLIEGMANISSAANGFTGMVQSDYYGGHLSGQVNGRFYGPSGEEIGGAMSLVDNNRFAGVAEFTGSKGTLTPYFTNMTGGAVRSLASFRNFDTDARTTDSVGDMTNGTYHINSSDRTYVQMSHHPTQGYLLISGSTNGSYSAVTSTPRPDLEMYGQPNSYLVIENPQVPGAVIDLTYASFAAWQTQIGIPNANGPISIIYGDLTAPSQMPRNGAATYSGGITGTAEKNGYGYQLSGTSNFNVNFASGGVTGNANITGTPAQGAPMLPSLSITLDFVDGQILRGAPIWSGSIKSGATSVGTIDARFYGPGAAEMAGYWKASVTQGSDAINMVGSVFSKKQ